MIADELAPAANRRSSLGTGLAAAAGCISAVHLGTHGERHTGRRFAMRRSTTPAIGPVDCVVVEFGAGAQPFGGELALAIAELHDRGVVRVLDLLVVAKSADGEVAASEVPELVELSILEDIDLQIADLLSAQDVARIGAALAPGTVAGVVVWEHRWAEALTAAAGRCGGSIIANDRIPAAALAASLAPDHDAAASQKGGDHVAAP